MSAFFPSQHNSDVSFVGHTLILPTLSIGRVGCFAVDLVAYTWSLQRVGFIDDENVLPVAGNDALASNATGELFTNLEVYQDKKNKLTLIQQRAPVIKNRNAGFASNLFEWIKASQFKEVIILASVDSARRTFNTQFANPYTLNEDLTKGRYIATEGSGPKGNSGFDWLPMEEGSFDLLFKGTSFAAMLLHACKSSGLPASILTVFCGEGLNFAHAFSLATALYHYLPISEERSTHWVPPSSWRHLFEVHSPFDAVLFG